MKTYNLTEAETALIKSYEAQHQEAGKRIEELTVLQHNINGAKQGVIQCIASQQQMVTTDGDRFSLDVDAKILTVTEG